MLTNEDVIAKIEWEGWPDAVEWLVGEEVEDPEVGRLLNEAADHHIELDKIYRLLMALLGED